MAYKLCVFDIDGVLNPVGKPLQKESMKALKRLEEQGLRISFASGKHPWYIAGGLMFSGLLREDTIIIGESGGHVFFPQRMESVLYTKHLQDINKLKKLFYEKRIFSLEFWEEPKETSFTLFMKKPEKISEFVDTLEEIIQKEKLDLYIIKHLDAVDIIQKGLSKDVGLKVLCESLNISFEDIIGFGDGMNDLEMLSFVGYPVTVANAAGKIKEIVKERGGYISRLKYGEGVLEASDFIIENILQNRKE